jgi:DNA-binding transcriptional ArsR family regulator
MDADANIAPVAALMADPTRSSILWALSDGRSLPACELALRAGVKAPTISYHRYYRLANPAVMGLLETLAVLAPPAPARTFREGQTGKSLRFARTCYDHLAGRLGVQVTEALVGKGCLEPGSGDYVLTPAGETLFSGLGVDVENARAARRVFARACLDWSERRHHLAGALGAVFLDRLFELRWIERMDSSRAVRLTDPGRSGLRERLRLEI